MDESLNILGNLGFLVDAVARNVRARHFQNVVLEVSYFWMANHEMARITVVGFDQILRMPFDFSFNFKPWFE